MYVSATIDNGVLCNKPVNLKESLGFSPDQVHKCDVHPDVIAFNQGINNYEAESRFNSFVWSTSVYHTNNVASKRIF